MRGTLIFLLALLTFALPAFHSFGQDKRLTNEPPSHLFHIKTSVSNLLAVYKRDNNVQHLQDAYDIATTWKPSTNYFYYNEDNVRERIQLVLMIVNVCHNAADPNFDPEDRPSAKVSPPRTSTQHTHPGMEPLEISDPDVRKQYMNAIVENNIKIAKYNREVILRNIVTRGIGEAKSFLQQYQTSPLKKAKILEYLTNFINEPFIQGKLVEGRMP